MRFLSSWTKLDLSRDRARQSAMVRQPPPRGPTTFERVRSVFALPTRMTGKSSMSKESTRDAQVAGYHL